MEKKYAKESFETYETRVMFEVYYLEILKGNPVEHSTQMTVYTEEVDRDKIKAFLDTKKTNKVKSIDIFHFATKEQDDLASELIEKTLNDW